jgi:hypothetical protein
MSEYGEQARREVMTARGHWPNLLGAIDAMPPAAQQELFRLVRNLKDDLARAERKSRPFPGGPRTGW